VVEKYEVWTVSAFPDHERLSEGEDSREGNFKKRGKTESISFRKSQGGPRVSYKPLSERGSQKKENYAGKSSGANTHRKENAKRWPENKISPIVQLPLASARKKTADEEEQRAGKEKTSHGGQT